MIGSVNRFSLVLPLLAAVAVFPATAQELHARSLSAETKSPPIVTRGAGIVTQLDFDVFMQRIPENQRPAFVSDPDRIGEALTSLMLPRQLANRAMQTYGEAVSDPIFQARMQQALIVLLAERYMEQSWNERKLDDYEAQARELYMVRKDLLRKPLHADFTHVLVRAGSVRSELDAMRSIINVYELLDDDVALPDLAVEYSEDPNVGENRGRYEAAVIDELDSAVAESVRTLEPGQISQPFRSELGWHIVELHDRYRPELGTFEQERDRAIEIARNRHRQQVRERILQEANQVEAEYAPNAIEDLLERYEPTTSDLEQLERDIRGMLRQPATPGSENAQ